MFSVYGKSRLMAKKVIMKKSENPQSDIAVALYSNYHASQEEKQVILDRHIDEEFKRMKEKRCSHELSTPELVKECISLMKKDTANFSNLSLMKKVKKKTSEKTGKTIYTWVELGAESDLFGLV